MDNLDFTPVCESQSNGVVEAGVKNREMHRPHDDAEFAAPLERQHRRGTFDLQVAHAADVASQQAPRDNA